MSLCAFNAPGKRDGEILEQWETGEAVEVLTFDFEDRPSLGNFGGRPGGDMEVPVAAFPKAEVRLKTRLTA